MTQRLLSFPTTTDPHASVQSDRQLLLSMGIQPTKIRVRHLNYLPLTGQPDQPDPSGQPITFLELLKAASVMITLGSICCGLWMVAWMGVTAVVRMAR